MRLLVISQCGHWQSSNFLINIFRLESTEAWGILMIRLMLGLLWQPWLVLWDPMPIKKCKFWASSNFNKPPPRYWTQWGVEPHRNLPSRTQIKPLVSSSAQLELLVSFGTLTKVLLEYQNINMKKLTLGSFFKYLSSSVLVEWSPSILHVSVESGSSWLIQIGVFLTNSRLTNIAKVLLWNV